MHVECGQPDEKLASAAISTAATSKINSFRPGPITRTTCWYAAGRITSLNTPNRGYFSRPRHSFDKRRGTNLPHPQATGPEKFYEPLRRTENYAAGFALCGLAVAVFIGLTAWGRIGFGALLGVPLLIAGLAMLAAKDGRDQIARIATWNTDHGRTEYMHVPGGTSATLLASISDSAPTEATGLVIRYGLTLHRVNAEKSQRARAIAAGDSSAIMQSPAAPPRSRLNQLSIPATWGGWFYALDPGTYEVQVEVEGSNRFSTAQVDTGPVQRSAQTTVTVIAGEVTYLDARAHVYRVWRPENGQVESFTPRLALEAY